VTRGISLGVQGGRGSPEQGVPWRCNLSGGERRWGCGGAVEGAGKVVEVAHGVGAELGSVLRGSERGQSGYSRRPSDAEQGKV
jgi:hypothetical protein